MIGTVYVRKIDRAVRCDLSCCERRGEITVYKQARKRVAANRNGLNHRERERERDQVASISPSQEKEQPESGRSSPSSLQLRLKLSA